MPNKLLTTGEDWKALVARIKVDHAPVSPRVCVIDADAPLGVMLLVERYAVDAIPPHGKVRITVGYKVANLVTEEREACAYIRDLIAGNLAHEVAEHFQLDGVRIFAPHSAKEQTRAALDELTAMAQEDGCYS